VIVSPRMGATSPFAVKMAEKLQIDYQKVVDLTDQGEARKEIYLASVYANYAAVDSSIGCFSSFEEMAKAVNPSTILQLLKEHHEHEALLGALSRLGGLTFNGQWYPIEELSERGRRA
jgi:hypothetical protein